jgi:hypothetical protein
VAWHLLIVLSTLSLLGARTLARLDAQTREYEASTVLVGRVENGAERVLGQGRVDVPRPTPA